ncbi:uncharacterized protein CDV56_103977 [Aspergillus thermomutatus]|uniref:C2H2-type domain-containing protein n=1 Tax=Aspergillus thermomutatus TaxID=41047 RepID=A0A397GLC0_ASPTH|nr:uncharacterized protein CDV56_103977 [Aspergillus thermomutatus]RHZ51665.1 hypothetical protein CDV56_103977 [Aspergillus thermomutatus]
MARTKRTAAELFDEAERNGASKSADEAGVNGDMVMSKIEPGTTIKYDRMLDLWDEHELRNPGASPSDLKAAKYFMYKCCEIWKAGKPDFSMHTACQRWTEFGAGLKRRPGNEKIPGEVSQSVRNYIKGSITKKLGLSQARREQHFLTLPHFVILIKHMWQKDWHRYHHPGTMVLDHAAYMLFIYTSARVGDIFESSMRRGSVRGLLYSDVVFVVFKNEAGRAEIAVRATRDAKGFTNKPHKRPQHAMYEDMEPLFANPVLPLLAIALANHAFQDYDTFEAIEAIPPREDGLLTYIRFKEEMQDVPFFQTLSSDGPTGQIQKADSFNNRSVHRGHRAGYEANITMHAVRREALVKADDHGYSTAERMKFAGHGNSKTFFGSYMPPISTVDGQSSYWNRPRRTDFLEGFRGLSLTYHPQMLRSLPAKVEADLQERSVFVTIDQEIKSLGEKIRALGSEREDRQERTRREELYWQKRQIMSEELSRWQEIQTRKVPSDPDGEDCAVAARSSWFHRVRWLDPPRDRLADILLVDSPLRSPQGREALECMITLCRENPTVAYRPSLRPTGGCCVISACAMKLDSLQPNRRWDHIYQCYQAELQKTDGFAELCFQCDTWVTAAAEWNDHCQNHLDDMDTLPVQFNPLTFRHTLAAAGQCLFCLFNRNLPSDRRFKQYLTKQHWIGHLQGHFQELQEKFQSDHGQDETKTQPCPDPRCALSFNTFSEFQCHCKDIHCIDRITIDTVKRCRRIKGSADEKDNFILFTECKTRRCSEQCLPDDQNDFVSKASSDVSLGTPVDAHIAVHVNPCLVMDQGEKAGLNCIDPRLREPVVCGTV